MPTLSESQIKDLLDAATQAQELAHAPYSKYRVGAAILAGSGKLYLGANIENQSYGATVCAERTAICQFVMGGESEIVAVGVVTPDDGWPCGICLQSIKEFVGEPQDCKIVVPFGDSYIARSLHELAPYLWSSSLVRK